MKQTVWSPVKLVILVFSLVLAHCSVDPDYTSYVASELISVHPDDGAIDVSVELAEIDLEFSIPMTESGSLSLTGGNGVIETGVWSTDKKTVSFPITGFLSSGASYEVYLNNFTDQHGDLPGMGRIASQSRERTKLSENIGGPLMQALSFEN